MVVNSKRFSGLGACDCRVWQTWCCNPNTNINTSPNAPYGAPGWVGDLIGGSAYTLTSLFGKYQQPQQNYGFDVGAYMPIILIGGAAVLLVSLMKR